MGVGVWMWGVSVDLRKCMCGCDNVDWCAWALAMVFV